MATDLPRAIFLTGPTAAGKTDLSLMLADEFNGEIVSVDSAQVYIGMDIGTAKPEAAIQQQVPHHLIDLCDPAVSYSAANFREDALTAMTDITERGRVPILVGGTALYFKALVQPMAAMPPADAEVRAQLQGWLDAAGLEALVAELQAVDPQAWARIDRQNPQRVLRALEVQRISGRPISEFWAASAHDGRGGLSEAALDDFPWQVVQFAVSPDERSVLHQRIEQRFQSMLEMGFEDEVVRLFQRGDLHLDLPSIRAVGYRQMWQYLSGELEYRQMTAAGIAATRQLAKRQLTWMRGWEGLNWLDSQADDLFDQARQRLRKKVT
ncbi:tRNA (adenosine(37)-N6)-dimethylallyltransferase MiaA [Saccharospirillum sp. MSK14-1]|uniref:tRNA (adenosine(37)-N6)-dimethylallyltransferase MiaA n=1 Tax=Saccharospirillum sp. MSK14-1 TaxID=1897632 RepID=UPI000D4048B3|nr:tRNA (adenosine(37)-N6)-dimethylallyltransferase MiaA [Saccharospirillum sp. MSK14-1]PTY35920.1 tRNA (adenosine(37)-N6)-dimethylallyltransferase MiaA [Saccharospirillum sp. MSK14-1]